ncbi:unnamed protein product [Miscanthus lutarioriparius]|uniref:Signal peptide peptidase n=1 Tax=Miscanthus lutarioriparius TaxID=422564 RepID=A0A811PUW6_9POAL|nr:unnamed protein product [Miscanthus lutarioriparius]
MRTHERAANLALAGLSLAPLVVNVNPNVNVVLTACLTVYVGCYRSVKPTPPSETMSKEHAMRFPLVGSAMLLSLFLLFKFLSKDLVNAVLTAYFFILGIVALSATLLPSIKHFLPKEWNDNLIVWRAPFFHSLSVEFTKSQIVASIPGFFFCLWYASKKHWLANNVLGLAFCIQGIEMLSLGSFKTGAILLGGLFVYDIFWVFFTPVMVSVAKSFDAPIKLLFPTADAARPFSMLGLGDIVIPGIFVALALRFDVSRGIKNRYFNSAFLGYAVGMTVTIIVMNWFQAAQLLEFDESKVEAEEGGAEEEQDDDSSKGNKRWSSILAGFSSGGKNFIGFYRGKVKWPPGEYLAPAYGSSVPCLVAILTVRVLQEMKCAAVFHETLAAVFAWSVLVQSQQW